QVRWRVECQAGEYQRGGRGQGRDSRDAQERQALQGDGRQPLHRHPAQPAPQGPAPGPGRGRRGRLLMTTIKCQVSVADGEVYLPSMRRLGILIHSVQQMGLLEDGHVVSVEGVIDLTSPDTARESYQALLSKLDLPEEWDAMPFDIYL